MQTYNFDCFFFNLCAFFFSLFPVFFISVSSLFPRFFSDHEKKKKSKIFPRIRICKKLMCVFFNLLTSDDVYFKLLFSLLKKFSLSKLFFLSLFLFLLLFQWTVARRSFRQWPKNCLLTYVHIHTHAHIHIYTYTYTFFILLLFFIRVQYRKGDIKRAERHQEQCLRLLRDHIHAISYPTNHPICSPAKILHKQR